MLHHPSSVRSVMSFCQPTAFLTEVSPDHAESSYSPYGALTLSHPMMPYGVMVCHKLMGIYMGFLILGVIL